MPTASAGVEDRRVPPPVPARADDRARSVDVGDFSAPASAASTLPPVDDPALIQDMLRRYRRAYSGLDARLAHAVYPGLDEGALAHAFDGLRSQSLEFDGCTVDARGETASAICHGLVRYTPKIGSREPRLERRVWSFVLRKNDRDWTIVSARTDR